MQFLYKGEHCVGHKLSRSLAKDVREAFDMAEDMCGSLDPAIIEEARAGIREIRSEVLKLVARSKKGETCATRPGDWVRVVSGNGTDAFENQSALLWAHCVSEHAAILSPDTSIAKLSEYHDHEHEGPCTIRNHDRASRRYSLRKMGRVLSEAPE